MGASFPPGVTLPGALGGNTSAANVLLSLNGAATAARKIQWQTAGVGRFDLGLTNVGESGANAGSDLVLQRRSDAGALIDTILTVNRATGLFALSGSAAIGGTLGVAGTLTASSGAIFGSNTFNGVAQTINGINTGSRWTRWQSAGVTRWQMGPFGNETGSNAGSDMFLTAFDDSGANTNLGITLKRSTGGLAHTSSNVNSGTTVNNAASSALFFNQTHSGTSSVALGHVLNTLSITDTLNWSGSTNGVTGFGVNHVFGGGTTAGGRIALNVLALQVGPTGAGSSGAVITSFGRVSEPGATAAAPLGGVNGLNAIAAIQTGFVANNLLGVNAFEADVGISAGSSAAIRTAINAVNVGAVAGYAVDAAVWIYNGSSNLGFGLAPFRHGILFGDTQQWPVDFTIGTMIGANMGDNAHAVPYMTAKWGVDLDQVVFPATGNPYDGGALRAVNASLDGNGRLQLGSAYLTPSSSGLAVDTKGSFTTAAAIAAAGTGYQQATHYWTTQYGGIFAIVVSAGGSATGAVTQISPAQFPTGTAPANPVAAIDLNHTPAGVASPGSGLSLTLTWNTTASALSLQPTAGGKLSFNGVTPVIKPTGVAITAAGIHAALTSLGLIAP